MVGFVDDATGQVNSCYDNTATPEYLIECMGQDTQLWSDLLWLSGGYLESDKCLYHFVYYCSLADGIPIMQSKCPVPPLRVKQSQSLGSITIEYNNSFTLHKALGHYKAPAGAHRTQMTILGEKRAAYATKVQTSALTQI
eukprot:3778151-Ditylum_brightwellii.AAC.1